MVAIRELHYEFEIARNRIHAGLNKDISAVDVDAYLNQAKDIILERYDEIVEKNRKIESHLRTLEKESAPLKLIGGDSIEGINYYELPSDYYNYLRVKHVLICNSELGCNEPKLLLNKSYHQQDDLNESYKDPFRKPSWNFSRGLYNFTSNGLEFHHGNKYEIKKLTLMYIRYISDVAGPTMVKQGVYLKSDGITVLNKDIDLDLPRNQTLWRKVVQIASYLCKKDLDNNYKEEIDSFLFNQNIGVS